MSSSTCSSGHQRHDRIHTERANTEADRPFGRLFAKLSILHIHQLKKLTERLIGNLARSFVATSQQGAQERARSSHKTRRRSLMGRSRSLRTSDSRVLSAAVPPDMERACRTIPSEHPKTLWMGLEFCLKGDAPALGDLKGFLVRFDWHRFHL